MTTHIITDPKEVQAKMVSLHHELGNFQYYNARNGSIPPKFEGEEYEAITFVLGLIEREVQRLSQHIRRENTDKAVIDSLRNAGVDVGGDQPAEGDSK